MRGHPPSSPSKGGQKGREQSQLTPSSSLNQLPISPSPPGQQTAHSNKLNLKVLLTQDVFVAGMTVNGMLEVGVSSDRLALGELGIELAAFEELRSLDFTNTRRLYSKSITFQSATTPPSNAIVPGAILTPSGFYPALRGRTRFAFSFHLPDDLPSSCHLGGNALVRYELVGRASSMIDQAVDMKTRKVEVKVVEKWDDWSGPVGFTPGGNIDFQDPERLPKWLQGGERKGSGQLKLAGDGRLEIVARIGMGDVDPALIQGPKRVGRLFWTGLSAQESGNAEIDVVVKVKNASKRTVSGLKLSIARRLRILSQGKSKPSSSAPQITSTISSDRFQGIGYAFPAGETRIVVATIQVPTQEECWTVRKGSLFELDAIVRVEVECGFLSKDLVVEIPIWIAHPRSLPAAAHEQYQHHLAHPHSPAFPLDPPTFPRSQSQQSLGISYTYPFAPGTPNEFGGVEGRSRTPETYVSSNSGYATSTSGYGTGSIASSVSSPALFRHAQQNVYFAPPPPPPPPLSPAYWAPPPTQHPPPFHPISPSPSFVSSPYSYAAPTPNPNGYVAFDATQPDFTQSTLLAQSSTFATHLATQQPQQVFVPTEVTVGYSSGSSAMSSASSSSFPAPPSGPPPAAESVELYRSQSQPNLSVNLTQEAAPLPAKSPTPSELSARKPPSRPPSAQARAAPPPPPAPSSRFHSPSPSSSPAPNHWSSLPTSSLSHSTSEAFLLDTIGEDGESQAGTAKSLAALSSSFGSPKASSPGRLSMSVQDLEDFVDDQEALKKWEESEGPKTPDLDKTLPPVPMPKEKEVVKPPRVQDIFREQEVEKERVESPTTTGSPIKRAFSPRQKPGLSALEARLLRPATPELSARPSRSQSLPSFDVIRKPVKDSPAVQERSSLSISTSVERNEPEAPAQRKRTTLDISRFTRSTSMVSISTETPPPLAPSVKRAERVASPRSPSRSPDRHSNPPVIDTPLPRSISSTSVEPTMEELLRGDPSSPTMASPLGKSGNGPIKVLQDVERDGIAAGMKSARGGKGGQVTSVANIWAQMAQEPSTPLVVPAPTKQSSTPASTSLALRSLSNERQMPDPSRPRTSSSPSKQVASSSSTSLPPLALKRWSSPAPAKTFLNTTSSSAAVKVDRLPEKGVSPGIAKLIQKYSSQLE